MLCLEPRTGLGGPCRDRKVFVCLLGQFRLVRGGVELSLRRGGKAEALLCALALREGYRADRDVLLQILWPQSGTARAAHSLTSLVHSLRRRLVNDRGVPLVVHSNGTYALDADAGVGVDVTCFDQYVEAGLASTRAGDARQAVRAYERAVALYLGDVSTGNDLHAFIERERLRARFLGLLGTLADHYFAQEQYGQSLGLAQRLLRHDPCREDAHRLVMRCYSRIGQRAQALRQYRVCRQLLADEYDAAPEPTTEALFRQLRTDPASV